MKDIIGLAVLSSPLFLVIPWLIVAVWAAVKTSQPRKSAVAKLAVGAGTLVVVFLLPFTDDIAGRIYFNHLCKTDAGAKVYQTIELPAKYWDENGKPKFYDERTGNMTITLSQYADISSSINIRSFGIEEHQSTLLDKTTHQKISDNPWFLYWGGWIRKTFSLHNTALHCGGESDLVRKLFTENKLNEK